MTKTEFIKLISFCILMENGRGIMSKSPSYVLKKWETKDPAVLDMNNANKLYHYQDDWASHIDSLED